MLVYASAINTLKINHHPYEYEFEYENEYYPQLCLHLVGFCQKAAARELFHFLPHVMS